MDVPTDQREIVPQRCCRDPEIVVSQEFASHAQARPQLPIFLSRFDVDTQKVYGIDEVPETRHGLIR